LTSPRLLLVALLVASTAAFAVGASVERSSDESHDKSAAAVESSEAAGGEASETGEEAHSEEVAGRAEEGGEESVLGVDLDGTPFVVLGAVASLGLALAVWLHPEWRLLLGLVAAAMVAFAVLDAREVVHQVDEDNGGLAVLAGVVAVLHLAAAAVAFSIGRSAAVAPRDSGV
jgi:hypothetical protein